MCNPQHIRAGAAAGICMVDLMQSLAERLAQKILIK
jgi:hypothetical protein